MTAPTCVALHYVSLNGMFFSWEYHGVEPKTKAVPPFQAPSVHPSTSAFTVLGSVHIPDPVPIVVWVEPTLSFTLGRELDLEWLIVCISQYHPVRPHL